MRSARWLEVIAATLTTAELIPGRAVIFRFTSDSI